MTTHSTVLTDVDNDVWHDRWQIDASNGPRLTGASDWSIGKRTLRGGLSDGIDVVTVHNGALTIDVMPTRGMGLWRGRYRDMPLGWASPVARPVHPALVDANDRGGIGWLNGFNELLCRCGLAWNGPPGIDVVPQDDGSTQNAPLTLHGKIANLAAHYVQVDVSTDGDGILSVTGIIDEASMFGSHLRLSSMLTTIAGTNRIRIHDSITNLSSAPAETQLLYHTNLGSPLLAGGSMVAAAFSQMAPRDERAAEGIASWETCLAPALGYAEQVYYFDPVADDDGFTQVLLKNAAGDRGLSVRFATAGLPCFSLWKNTQAEQDGYCAGLEPATNYPNSRMFEREHNRVVRLDPGAAWQCDLELAIHEGHSEVAAIDDQIRQLQSRSPRTICDRPTRPFSPA